MTGTLESLPTLKGKLSGVGGIAGKLSGTGGLRGKLSSDSRPVYQGELTITPGEEEQTLATAGMALNQNIVIEPIPSNYGRISYSGSILTVW